MSAGHGWFGNHRSLKEQLLGLGPALAEAKGRTVLDAGTAEGHIAFEFVRAGAKRVDAFDNNAGFVCEAENLAYRKARGQVRVKFGDINVGLPDPFSGPYDIVLALAVIHKATDVAAATRLLAVACGGLMVVRLPKGSSGIVSAKFGDTYCDLHEEMPALGFRLEKTEQGPRSELVMYWRKNR